MLEHLFVSKVRVKILRVFTANPEITFHVRGLVREISEEINAVRRELQNLERAKILQSVKKGNKVVYSVNPHCYTFPELMSLFRKDDPVVKQIHQALETVDDIFVSILTGSFLSGQYADPTDVDLLIVGTPELEKLGKKIGDIEKEIGKTLKTIVMRPDEFDFKKKNRDAFLSKILKSDKVLLTGDTKDLFS